MNKWAAGDSTTAARFDPTAGALVVAVVNIFVTLNLHTQLGISEDDLMRMGLHLATILLVLRSGQLSFMRRKAPGDQPADAGDAAPKGVVVDRAGVGLGDAGDAGDAGDGGDAGDAEDP